MAWKLTYVLIQACTELDGGWFGVVWYVDDPARVRQGVGAAHREAVRSRERASPADLHCQDERLFSVGAAASNSRLLLHPFPHPPLPLHFSLRLSWLSPQYDIVVPLHVYPVAMVTQCRRCHSKITQGGIHRSPEFSSPPIYVFSAAIWFICFPAVQFHVNTNNPQHNGDGGSLSTPQSETIYCTSIFPNHGRCFWFDIFLLQNGSCTTKTRITTTDSVAHQKPSAFSLEM